MPLMLKRRQSCHGQQTGSNAFQRRPASDSSEARWATSSTTARRVSTAATIRATISGVVSRYTRPIRLPCSRWRPPAWPITSSITRLGMAASSSQVAKVWRRSCGPRRSRSANRRVWSASVADQRIGPSPWMVGSARPSDLSMSRATSMVAARSLPPGVLNRSASWSGMRGPSARSAARTRRAVEGSSIAGSVSLWAAFWYTCLSRCRDRGSRSVPGTVKTRSSGSLPARELPPDRLDDLRCQRDRTDGGRALGAALEAAAELSGLVADRGHLEDSSTGSRSSGLPPTPPMGRRIPRRPPAPGQAGARSGSCSRRVTPCGGGAVRGLGAPCRRDQAGERVLGDVDGAADALVGQHALGHPLVDGVGVFAQQPGDLGDGVGDRLVCGLRPRHRERYLSGTAEAVPFRDLIPPLGLHGFFKVRNQGTRFLGTCPLRSEVRTKMRAAWLARIQT